jgi:hypothetical protein
MTDTKYPPCLDHERRISTIEEEIKESRKDRKEMRKILYAVLTLAILILGGVRFVDNISLIPWHP